MSAFYYNVTTVKTTELQREELKEISISSFGCLGIQELGMIESEVDELLGRDAYCGGEIPEKVLKKIEDYSSESNEIKYFFSDKSSMEQFTAYLSEANVEFSVQEEKVEDWNKEWKKHFRPIVIDNELSVLPVWSKESNRSSQNIIINPGMGFGTGTHETTFLCLKLFKELTKDNNFKNCLDLGCGSGILGIGYSIYQNSNVTYCDIDKEALDNCVENIQLNFKDKNISGTEVILRSRLEAKKYDLIFANILESALIEEYETILSSSADKGIIILSGLLNEQVDSIINHYGAFSLLKSESKGDWSALVMRKN